MPDHPSALGRWEQRWHPLRRAWVVYCAHRNTRPWSGERGGGGKTSPAYDAKCYLCPRNTRAQGHVNPDYRDVFVFDNDYPVVGAEAPEIPGAWNARPLYRRERAAGLARVVCFDPRHNVTLSEMKLAGVVRVMDAWRSQVRELAAAPGISFALIFENKGEMVGVSSPHPHCQIYATGFTFKHIEMELEAVAEHRRERAGNLFAAILEEERRDGTRIVAENEHAIAFLPFFARWSYETWIFPKKRRATLAELDDQEVAGLAALYQEVTRRLDLVEGSSFPYVMSLYQAPLKGGAYGDYHLHFVFLPPLRSPGLKKFPAGPEIGGGNFMSDTLPEDKARELRSVDLPSFKEAP